MTVSARLVPVVFMILAVLTAGTAVVRSNADQAATMTEAAVALLEVLEPEQRQATLFPFDGEDRFDWHFIPRERKGLSLKAMSAEQREAALALLRASFSAEGFDKAERVRHLEQILFEREGRAMRDTELYFFMVFGEPTATGTWGWRYEGHHLSHSWTVVDGELSASTPQFFGANPGVVRHGSRAGTRVLGREEGLARALLNTLSGAALDDAVISFEAPRDILTSADRMAAMQDDLGVAYSALDRDQQELLWTLISEYAAVQPDAIADERLAQIHEAGLDQIKFAWMGGGREGEPHYYRIQGPTFLIEYDNVQNNANHIHSVWRDFDGDFGRDLLAAHYQRYRHRGVNAD